MTAHMRSNQPENVTLEEVLTDLEAALYGRNYQVFLRAYRTQYLSRASAEAYVHEALGSHVAPQIEPTTGPEILGAVGRALQWTLDEHSGPEPGVLESPRFTTLLRRLLVDLEGAITQATLLARFELSDEHHPAYPVYWDFAYVIAGPQGGLVLVGSSSD